MEPWRYWSHAIILIERTKSTCRLKIGMAPNKDLDMRCREKYSKQRSGPRRNNKVLSRRNVGHKGAFGDVCPLSKHDLFSKDCDREGSIPPRGGTRESGGGGGESWGLGWPEGPVALVTCLFLGMKFCWFGRFYYIPFFSIFSSLYFFSFSIYIYLFLIFTRRIKSRIVFTTSHGYYRWE